MSHKIDIWARQYEVDVAKARRHLEAIDATAKRRGLGPRYRAHESGKVATNLRTLQRLNDEDTCIQIPIARTRWPFV